jgi:hypothetical protein
MPPVNGAKVPPEPAKTLEPMPAAKPAAAPAAAPAAKTS